MNWLETFNLSILIHWTLFHHKNVHCSNFELISMQTSPTVEILPNEVIATVFSSHWLGCANKCRELENPSQCNTIQFDQSTHDCLLAHKEISQNICPSEGGAWSKRSVDGQSKRRKRSGFSPFPAQVFVMKSLLPIGDQILINNEPVPVRNYGNPNDQHIRNGQAQSHYYNILPPWLAEKFPMPGTLHYKVNSNPQILYLTSRTKTYLLKKVEWEGIDLSCWNDMLENGNWVKDGESKIYYRIMEPGIYNLDVNKALYLFEEF